MQLHHFDFSLFYYCKCKQSYHHHDDHLLLLLCFFFLMTVAVSCSSGGGELPVPDIHQAKELNESTIHKKSNDEKLRTQLYGNSKDTSNISRLSDSKFADLYLSSYWHVLGGEQLHSSHPLLDGFDSVTLPKRWDWREHGIITPVRNQKSCGGCWAFATTETVESVYALTHNISSEVQYSVQEIIDCSTNNAGCKGGSPHNALVWLYKTSAPLVSDSLYPLTDKSDACKMFPLSTPGLVVTNFTHLSPIQDERQLLYIIYKHGPVVAGVDADTLNNYIGGIIQFHCGTKLNHAVQIVGYDQTGDVPYYIIRNSWGKDWGHDGYLYVRYGMNTCGITESIDVVLEVEQRILPEN